MNLHSRNVSGRITSLILFLILGICFTTQFIMAHDLPMKVLVLSSYHHGDPWNDRLIEGIGDTLSQDQPVILDVSYEFLDFRRFRGPDYSNLLNTYLQFKYEQQVPEVIILSDDDALDYVLSGALPAFLSIPMVITGINNLTPQRVQGFENMTGVNERVSMKETLDLALNLFPNTSSVYVLVDNLTQVGQANLGFFRQIVLEYPQRWSGVEFIELLNFTEAEAHELLPQLSNGSIILRAANLMDNFDGFLSVNRTMEYLADHTRVPIFSFWEFDIGYGALGGIMVSGYEQGVRAAELALEILQGKQVATIPFVMESPNIPIFDYNQLERFGINRTHLPLGSQVYSEPPSFWYQYRYVIWGTLSVIVFLSLLLLGTLTNLQIQKKAEKALRLSEAKYRAYVDNAPLGIMLIDEHGNYQDTNPEAIRMTGYSIEDLKQLTFGDLLEPEYLDQGIQHFQEMKDGKIVTFEIPIRTKLQDLRWWNIAALKLDEQSFLGIHEDITERKQAEIALKKAQEEAQAANRAKSAFLATMSHEIRTPLNGILGMLQLLEDQTPLNDEQIEYVRIALQSGDRLTRLLTDLIDLSRIEAGKMELHEIQFSPNALFKEITDLMGLMVREKHISLVAHVDPSVPKIIIGDELRLRQILLNLVGNALKFTHQGGVSVAVTRVDRNPIATSNQDRVWIEFAVQDTGIGIPQDKIQALFEPFVQIETNYTRRYQGAGLGLSIVKTLTELLGGEIQMTSSFETPPTGTLVTLVIPFGIENTSNP